MSHSSEIPRGNTDTIILGILREEDSYGYEIMKNIIQRSNGLVDIKDATIYTAFKSMEKDSSLSALILILVESNETLKDKIIRKLFILSIYDIPLTKRV